MKEKFNYKKFNTGFFNNDTVLVKISYFVLINLTIFFCFFGAYCYLYNTDNTSFLYSQKEQLTNEDLIYFCANTHTTTGYGDIIPISKAAKQTTSSHVVVVLFFNIIFAIVCSSI